MTIIRSRISTIGDLLDLRQQALDLNAPDLVADAEALLDAEAPQWRDALRAETPAGRQTRVAVTRAERATRRTA